MFVVILRAETERHDPASQLNRIVLPISRLFHFREFSYLSLANTRLFSTNPPRAIRCFSRIFRNFEGWLPSLSPLCHSDDPCRSYAMRNRGSILPTTQARRMRIATATPEGNRLGGGSGFGRRSAFEENKKKRRYLVSGSPNLFICDQVQALSTVPARAAGLRVPLVRLLSISGAPFCSCSICKVGMEGECIT